MSSSFHGTVCTILQAGVEQLKIRQLTVDDATRYKALRLEALRNHPEAFGSDYEAEKIDPSNGTQLVLKANSR